MLKIYDTDRVPLLIRLPVLILGVFALGLATNITAQHLFHMDLGLGNTQETGSPLVGCLLLYALSFFFISIWFLQNQFFFDSDQNELVIRHRGLFGKSKKTTSLKNAQSIYIKMGHIRAAEFWNIGIEFQDETKQWLTRIDDKNEADIIAAKFSETTKLPLKFE